MSAAPTWSLSSRPPPPPPVLLIVDRDHNIMNGFTRALLVSAERDTHKCRSISGYGHLPDVRSCVRRSVDASGRVHRPLDGALASMWWAR